ncbi:MAG: outer membrane beta-barrel protein [Filimonas sp.]|nr:outer membrane beta-barrel protein [Filimonas sp.]
MRNPIYNDDFENYLQQKAEQHRMYPADQVWRNIQEQLHGKKQWPALPFISICIIAALVITTLLLTPADPMLRAGNAEPQQKTAVLNVPGPLLETLSPTLLTQESLKRAKGYPQATQVDENLFASTTNTPEQIITTVTPSPEAEAIAPKESNNLLAKGNTRIQTNTLVTAQPLVLQSAATPNNNTAADTEANTLVTAENRKNDEPQVNNDIRQSTLEESKQAELMAAPPVVAPRKTSRFEYHLYVTPAASYRRLVDEKNKAPQAYFASPMAVIYNSDVNKVVKQSPALGLEAGFAIGYKINPQFTIRGGIQYNMRQYNIETYGINYEPAFIVLNGRNERVLNTFPMMPGIKSNYVTTLKNKTSEISIPLGIDWKSTPNRKFSFGATASIQPTYSLNNTSYIITTDYKNYADGSALARKWNINTSFDAYVSYQWNDGLRWQIGPQFRYQQLSSLNTGYPIREYLLDYGIKIGVTKSFR